VEYIPKDGVVGLNLNWDGKTIISEQVPGAYALYEVLLHVL